MHVILVVLLSFALVAETLLAAPPAGEDNMSSQAVPSTLAISADWMNGSVSLLAPGACSDGECRWRRYALGLISFGLVWNRT